MTDFEFDRLRMVMACLVPVMWLVAALLPLSLSGVLYMPDWKLSVLLGAIGTYFVYSGIRALSKGWTSRFVLRVVVPVVPLLLSSVMVWTGLWFFATLLLSLWSFELLSLWRHRAGGPFHEGMVFLVVSGVVILPLSAAACRVPLLLRGRSDSAAVGDGQGIVGRVIVRHRQRQTPQ
jgi:hypothetical protein